MKPRIFKHDDGSWVLEWEGWENGFRPGYQWTAYFTHRRAVKALCRLDIYGMVKR